MVCGTNSDAGKSTVVTGLCRVLARLGVKVAPFKAQNMALNSYVTPSGHEIGRAQGVQALAARVMPEAAMNPILLKPTGERSSQVVVMGQPWAQLDAVGYQLAKPGLFGLVLDALGDLRQRFDVIICEGAGSPAEINLIDHDIVNLPLAKEAGFPALVVGDIDRGGVFAALFGTVALLPDDLRPLVKGFVINKLRGDPALLADGPAELERRCGVPTLGVLPYLHDIALDAEDSLALSGHRPRPAPDRAATGDRDQVDVAAVRFPRISNFTDLDALAIEPGVGVRLVDTPSALGHPDLVVLPGTKATVADLEWLRGRGFPDAIAARRTMVLGICGGYQMLGRTISDPVEAGRPGPVAGLGWLPVDTVFEPTKTTRQRRGRALGHRVSGYQIHHGRTRSQWRETPRAASQVVDRNPDRAEPWIQLDDTYGAEPDGLAAGAILGTTLHGLFEQDGFRGAFLAAVAARGGKRWQPTGVSFAAARESQIDRLADMVEAHLDLAAVEALLA